MSIVSLKESPVKGSLLPHRSYQSDSPHKASSPSSTPTLRRSPLTPSMPKISQKCPLIANTMSVPLPMMYMIRRIRMVFVLSARGTNSRVMKLMIPLWPALHACHPTECLSRKPVHLICLIMSEIAHLTCLIMSETVHFSRLIFGCATLLTREFVLVASKIASWIVAGGDDSLAVAIPVGTGVVALAMGNGVVRGSTVGCAVVGRSVVWWSRVRWKVLWWNLVSCISV